MEYLALAVGVAALAWGAVLLRQGGLLAGSLVVLLAGICFGHPFFNVPAGPLPVTIDRLLLVGLLALVVVHRRFGWAHATPLTKADWALIGLVAVLVLSTITHDWKYNKSAPLGQLLFFWLLPLGMYWGVRQVPLSERGLWAMFAVLGAFGIYLAVTAIAETRQIWPLVLPKYIASPTYIEFFGRGRGPLLNPAGSGILQGICLVGALMWWPRLGRVGQLMLLAIMPLYAYGIYCTFTRSVWLGAGLGLTVVVGLSLPRSWRVAVIGGGMLAALPVVAMNWEHLLAFKRDKDLSASEAAESAKLRPILAVVAWHMFLDRPLFGAGYGQYPVESKSYLSDRSTDLPLEKVRPYVQHNAFLALLTETGLPGMCLLIAALGFWLQLGWRLWQCHTAPAAMRQAGLFFLAVVGVWFPNAMFQDVLIIPMVNMVLLFFAAMTVNLAHQFAPQPATADHRLQLQPSRALGAV